MPGRMRTAIRRALNLGPFDPMFGDLAVAGHEIPCPEFTWVLPRPVFPAKALRKLRALVFSTVWQSIECVLNPLYEASADAGDFVGGLLGIDMDTVRCPDPSHSR